MSRSKKKSPVRAVTNAKSEKTDKQKASRKLRRKAKQILCSDGEHIPENREVSNVFSFEKDGKVYDASMPAKDLRK